MDPKSHIQMEGRTARFRPGFSQVLVHVCVHVCEDMCVCVCVSACVCVCVCVSECMCGCGCAGPYACEFVLVRVHARASMLTYMYQPLPTDLRAVPQGIKSVSASACHHASEAEVVHLMAFVQVRVYTKPKGKLPDFNDPVVMHRERCTVEDFCNKLHKTLIKQFK